MRRFGFVLLLTLAACGQPEAPPPLPAPPTEAVAPPWFICDAIDAPALLVFARDGDTVRVAQYDKPNGAIIQRTDYRAGRAEGAAGSVYTTLIQNGAEAGAIRQVNPGVLETPGSAYTTPFTSVRIGEREISCRWLPRTRVFGFTGRRSFVIHEDASGDLIYTTYDFMDAAGAQPIELTENGRTTTFSAEVRDGAEDTRPDGSTFTFAARDGFTYVIALDRDGTGRLDVQRNGEDVQSEPLIAFQQASGAE
jgi:hypothetical protein